MRGWCKQGWHEVPKERLINRRPGHDVCIDCLARTQTPNTAAVDESKPHRVPRKTPDTPLRKEWQK